MLMGFRVGSLGSVRGGMLFSLESLGSVVSTQGFRFLHLYAEIKKNSHLYAAALSWSFTMEK